VPVTDAAAVVKAITQGAALERGKLLPAAQKPASEFQSEVGNGSAGADGFGTERIWDGGT